MELDVVEILKDMVRLDTSNNNEYLMTDYIANILGKCGIEFDIIEPAQGRKSIISILGDKSEENPIAFISHIDVVSANESEWKYKPFDATQEDGFIYGRGTLDTKFLTAISLVTFIKLSQEPLNRQIIFIASADEEQGSKLGMPHVVHKYKDLLRNALVINEGGGFLVENKKDKFYTCTAGEKGRCEVHIKIEGTPSAASFPNQNRSTHKFLKVLERLSNYEFEIEENDVYKKYVSLLGSDIESPLLQGYKDYNCKNIIMLPTYEIGEAVNIMPKNIEFNFSVQLLPSKTQEDTERIVKDILDGLDLTYEIKEFIQGFSSDCTSEFFEELESITQKYFCKDARLLPVYALGRTDGRFLGNIPADVYGASLVSPKIPFKDVIKIVHQANEKVDVDTLNLGVEAYLELAKKMGMKKIG
ncbi:hypothetical protein AN639_06430 [Candidatus Epulonipiscium fishelsonii]|uniref:Uncharacterized protein n=1 Tax=Candidatus Epulonipiscium fishelsonii TaxID=77094 RepID=A0ACC8XAM8_9FIRM|nr:hypothetical protein AN639_06430 [Epulopiscium sp. SCG-B05WGA-EpuloA1]ONI39454.1 hypothetical protein AN396_08605 [Epulopiscium sp. SCG-B11WGA-EpuloA1]